MLSRRLIAARTILATLVVGCTLPWRGEQQNEINVIFQWRNNQILVEGSLDGRRGEFVIGSAQPRSVLDRAFPWSRSGESRLTLGERFSATVSPVVEDLGGVVDGILGADAWQNSTLTIDYARQIVIFSREAAQPMDGRLHRFEGPPSIPITIDGRPTRAILDTALPDTVVLPANGRQGRGSVRLTVAEHDLGAVDAAFEHTSTIRLGNRVLEHFLVKIDYRRDAISLWRDPRRA